MVEFFKVDGRQIRVRKAVTAPEFLSRTVLAPDPWDYVDLWLRRESQESARFYWQQSRNFATAASDLPATSAPLLMYYCMLNAVKALLTVREVQFNPRHGIGGERRTGGRGLPAEEVRMTKGGVFGAFAGELGEPVSDDGETFNLKQLLYNLVWIHRAFVLTYRSAAELYVPISKPRFVLRSDTDEVYFLADVDAKERRALRRTNMPAGYELYQVDADHLQLRRKSRAKGAESQGWTDFQEKMVRYHRETRRRIQYIEGRTWLWYVKRDVVSDDVIQRSSMVITIAAMHRLSELARYEPQILNNHLESDRNWLLSEFIRVAMDQFIDEIASEITGRDFMVPGTR